jgi:hypothetical protein
MPDDDLTDQISHLETQIERLAGVAERCRKIILASRAAIATGGLLLVAMTLGLLNVYPVVLVASITAVIGGIVSAGSNGSTLKQTTAAIGAAETLRAQLIGGIELRLVGDAAIEPD